MVTNIGNLPTIWSQNQSKRGLNARTNDFFKSYERRNSTDLTAILSVFGPFPPYSLVVGECLDGLPFMLSLDNPKSGSILVVGEHDWPKSEILTAMSVSACRINRPEHISWSLITNKPHLYSELVSSPHCQEVISPFDRAAGELIIELASTVEQRRFGRERGSTQVLMIDDFQSFTPMLSDYGVYLNLKTLVNKGPVRGIWPLISIKSEDAHTKTGQLLRTFGTYIFEKIERENSRVTPNTYQPDLQPNFNVIVGGRLIPISSLAV